MTKGHDVEGCSLETCYLISDASCDQTIHYIFIVFLNFSQGEEETANELMQLMGGELVIADASAGGADLQLRFRLAVAGQ